MKYADKIGAGFVVVLGDNEIDSGTAKLKNMKTGEQLDITLGDDFVHTFSNIYFADMMSDEKLNSLMDEFSKGEI